MLRGIQASARQRWGSDDLHGRTVALQGCGNVGFALALLLKEAGARLIVTDVDAARAAACARACDAAVVAPEEIYDAAADVFAPCALGGILNEQTIPRLQTAIIAGAANNQLRDEAAVQAIEARGILYAPDFILNAGGIISGGAYLLGESSARLEQRIAGISTGTSAVDLSVCTALASNGTSTKASLYQVLGALLPTPIASGSFDIGTMTTTSLDSGGARIGPPSDTTTTSDATPGTCSEFHLCVGFDAAHTNTKAVTVKVEVRTIQVRP